MARMNFNGLRKHRRDPSVQSKRMSITPLPPKTKKSRPISPINDIMIKKRMNITYDDKFHDSDSIHNYY